MGGSSSWKVLLLIQAILLLILLAQPASATSDHLTTCDECTVLPLAYSTSLQFGLFRFVDSKLNTFNVAACEIGSAKDPNDASVEIRGKCQFLSETWAPLGNFKDDQNFRNFWRNEVQASQSTGELGKYFAQTGSVQGVDIDDEQIGIHEDERFKAFTILRETAKDALAAAIAGNLDRGSKQTLESGKLARFF